MRTLNRFIIERLKLSKDTKVIQYNYHPKDFNELRSLLEQLLEERGKDADLNDIDVSQITNFCHNGGGLFEDLDPYNINISKWDVSNVNDMFRMFKGCKNFNCNLSKWDVSKVEDMAYMFDDCKNFDCDLSKWNISNVEDMHHMFFNCTNFIGQGLENWKPIKCRDMYDMFYQCENFDCDLSKWDVSNVRDMEDMFVGCDSLKNKPSWYLKYMKN